MLPLPDLEVYGGLVFLLLVCLPLGAVILRIGEWFVGQPVKLPAFERVLLSFYATGGLFFVVASIPAPLYGTASVVGLLVIGGLAYGVLAFREHARGLLSVVRWSTKVPRLLVGILTLGLLAIEVIGGSLVLPNGIDGAVDALFANRLLALHTIPWTLQPYASVGVTYPQGAAVWFSLPVVLFGWPIVAAPVVLPPLFLSLAPASAYCLGERWGASRPSRAPWMGLLFATFLGLVASWPRLYVGGSYDFIMGLPLFLVILGLLDPFLSGLPSWRKSVAFGVVLGMTAAVSTTVGTALGLLLLGYWAVSLATARAGLFRRFANVLASLGIALVMLARSLVGIAVWWGYPGHVMTANSVPPYSPLVFQETYGGVLSQIDPFSPWKWKVSPFPSLCLMLQVLLVGGLILAAFVFANRRPSFRRYLPATLVQSTLVTTGTLLLVTAAVGGLGEWNTSLSGIQSVTNLWELSILLFTSYSLVAMLPLVAAMNYLRSRGRDAPMIRTISTAGSSYVPRRVDRRRASGGRGAIVLAVAVLVVPLASGVAITSTSMTGYLHSYLLGQSNGTQEDVTVLEWAGQYLPSCSGVLAAPGSSAQFLPEYATVRIIYPAYPVPTNLTYYKVVQDLSNGHYGTATRAGMLSLNVTEVFVTGATTVTYLPFSVAPLQRSSDFDLLFSSGDAYLFAFEPGIAAQGCPPR